MSFRFDLRRGLIIVSAELTGPSGATVARLALDTGASKTLVNAATLVSIGYDPALAPGRSQITTGSGVAYAARLPIQRIAALGQECFDLDIFAHTLPASAKIDGLLGLDFFRDCILTIDFRRGEIVLDPRAASD
jgi:predicted aspartyl protease